MSNENERLESLLDQALKSYTPQEARAGLEQWLLASVTAENRPRPLIRNWKLAWVFAAGALLLAAAAIPVWIGSGRSQVAEVRRASAGQAEHSPQAQSSQVGPAFASFTQYKANPRLQRRHAAAHRPLQPQFGLQSPTPEQLLMLRLAIQEPEEMAALAKSKPDLNASIAIAPIPDDSIAAEPIKITPIEIKPIQISSLNATN
jgi:hypothetical protein